MTRALRKMSVEEVAVLLEWVCGEVKRSGRGSTSWLFDVVDGNETEGEDHWSKTLDTLTIVLDAHLPSLILNPTLLPQLQGLHALISTYVSTYRSVETKARGAIAGFQGMVEKDRKEREERESRRSEIRGSRGKDGKSKKEHRREWKKMVGEMDVGEYDIEVYKFT
ncbi:hypothetical protein HK097_003116 [Rhizophlyctis rosea]|uniref:Uncharacterized protein n=1 Tax=Rhizophlyctis rosea TaxID=64517 RepID=A0AAD5X091_9FUNG|nr:hypothetical protein HK097_003116 [Rhizophlyctis rosea]